MNNPSASTTSEFRRGWPSLLGCVVGVTVGASPIPFNTVGFFLPHLHREFGWGFGEMSVGVTIFGVLAAFLAPLFGGLADRFGTRAVATISLAIFGLIFASFAIMPASLMVYYGIWALMGMIAIGSTPVVFSRLVNLWFFRWRGLALGIMLVGTSIAAIMLPPLVTGSISNFGWRWAYAILACLPLFIGVPVGFFLLRQPRAKDISPARSGEAKGGSTLRQAVADKRFWIIWISVALTSLAFGGAYLHLPEITALHGFTESDAAIVMQVAGLSILAGRLIVGVLLDYLWAPLVALPLLSLPAVACWVLVSDSPLFSMMLLSAFLLGFAAGTESDVIAYLASRYFGLGDYGKIYGSLYMPFAIGSAISPAVYGMVRDATGGYEPALNVAAYLFVAAAVLLLFLGRYPVFSTSRPPQDDVDQPPAAAVDPAG